MPSGRARYWTMASAGFGRAISLALSVVLGAGLLAGSPARAEEPRSGDEFLIVDCLLPGQVRKLGRKMMFLSPRRPIKTTERDCEIRGGEYVSYDRADYGTALKIWLPLAQDGQPKAQTYVGEIAEKGLGQVADYEVAALWYRRAAKQGYGPAQINLGQLYEKGLGVERNMATAVMWYRRASGLGDADFQNVAFGDAAGEIERLQGALSERTQEVEALRTELSTLGQDLARARSDRQRVDAKLATERLRLKEERRALASRREALAADRAALSEALAADREADAAELERRAGELAEIQRRLDEREQLFAQREKQHDALGREIAELDAEIEKRRTEVAALRRDGEGSSNGKAGARDTAPPRIQMIEPRLVRSRGATDAAVVYTRANTKFRTIVGRVIAPGGFYRLFLNERALEVDENALFQTEVPVSLGPTRVEIVALDKAGRRAELAFELRPESPDATLAAEAEPEPEVVDASEIAFGRYHALMIGNFNYRHLPKLETPRADVDALAKLLQRKYGFETTILLNATRYEILSALNKLRATLTEEDNLLVYYAGHGALDKVNQRGYWQPVDAESDSTANWIANTAITDILNAMSVHKAMVIADSCYSGSLTRSMLARLDAGRSPEAQKAWLELMVEKKSRMAFTSGGLAPVLDGGGGRHSVFAKALLDALRDNSAVLDGRTLHQSVAQGVSYAAGGANFEQLPQYAPIQYAGHEAGDFFFDPGS